MNYYEGQHLAKQAIRETGPYAERIAAVQERLDRIMALPSFLRHRMQTQVAKLMQARRTLELMERGAVQDASAWIGDVAEG